METFLQQFGSKIKGVLTGFDRIVFKGCLRHLAYADGAAKFLARRGVLNKDYKAWMLEQSAAGRDGVGEGHDKQAAVGADRQESPPLPRPRTYQQGARTTGRI